MPAVLKSVLPILLVAAILAAVGWWVFWAFFDTYHLATVKEGVLYRDGVRSLHQFEIAAHRTHVKTVVSLVDDNEIAKPPFSEEMDYCRANGIDVIRVPILLGGWPTGEQVREFLSVATDPARQPVLVHCAQGVRRTGMIVAAYEMSVLGQNKDQTRNAMLTFGHSERMINDVKRFIDIYNPQERDVSTTLPTSRE